MNLHLGARSNRDARYREHLLNNVPSPAIAFVGRHNSGKTTLVVKIIEELAKRGIDVGSIKHHSHNDFEIDIPGKDSYRHREAGATETVIASPTKLARVKTLQHELECSEIVRSMNGHDIIIVEGYRKSGLPTIEIMRSGNERDAEVAKVFYERVRSGGSLQDDDIQSYRDVSNVASIEDDIRDKMPSSNTVAIASDIDEAREAADMLGIPCFDLEDTAAMTDFLVANFVRQKISVVIQAGGESKRMGESKALVQFGGRPLICRIIERVMPSADELIITTNEPEKLQFLFEMYPEANMALATDVYKMRGALPGLYTALNASNNSIVAMVACDMVFASSSLIVAESIEMAETGADVVVPVNKHGFEPFHATYRKESCEAAVKRAIEAGQTRVQALFSDPLITVDEFPQEKVLEVEPRGGCFINTNTRDELASIERNYLT